MPFDSFPLSAQSALGIAIIALAMAITPGPNMIYLISRAIGQGRRAGLISLSGTGLGFVIYLLMANFGLSIVFIAVPWLFIGFKAAGVAYLGWLAWQALCPGGCGPFEVRDLPKESDWRLFNVGLATNLLNPKAAIMYLTLIPQFIDLKRGHPLTQGLALGALQISVSLIINAIIVIGAGALAAFLSERPRWSIWQRRLTGSLLATVTLLLAREVPARAQV